MPHHITTTVEDTMVLEVDTTEEDTTVVFVGINDAVDVATHLHSTIQDTTHMFNMNITKYRWIRIHMSTCTVFIVVLIQVSLVHCAVGTLHLFDHTFYTNHDRSFMSIV